MFALAVGSMSLGCSTETRYRVFSVIFDGVPPPGTPSKPRRRPVAVMTARVEPPVAPLPDLESLEELVEEEDQQPHYESFAEILAVFPKDAQGNVDWVEAVELGMVAPRPSLDPEVQAPPPFPVDIKIDPGIPGFEVIFPHAAHTYWLGCNNCHQEIFVMKAGANPMSMAKIFEGEACGRCHGKVAFAPATGCPRCHVRLGGPTG
ncbi:MAG: hypothetical protein JRG95_18480 [Deltaproteobacteria bacterium]|nr:hypothetical protein [Deltaproteobacteria bacterium]